jgi:hypothetical protein
MKTTIKTEGTVFTSRKDIQTFLAAVAKAGVKINPTKAAGILKLTTGSVVDAWKRLEEDNNIEAMIVIKGRTK